MLPRFVLPFGLTLILLVTVNGSSTCKIEVHGHRRLDFDASRSKHATIITLNGSTVKTSEECGQSCCEVDSGICNVAEFSFTAKEHNCLLYSCQPENACSLKNNSDTYLSIRFVHSADKNVSQVPKIKPIITQTKEINQFTVEDQTIKNPRKTSKSDFPPATKENDPPRTKEKKPQISFVQSTTSSTESTPEHILTNTSLNSSQTNSSIIHELQSLFDDSDVIATSMQNTTHLSNKTVQSKFDKNNTSDPEIQTTPQTLNQTTQFNTSFENQSSSTTSIPSNVTTGVNSSVISIFPTTDPSENTTLVSSNNETQSPKSSATSQVPTTWTLTPSNVPESTSIDNETVVMVPTNQTLPDVSGVTSGTMDPLEISKKEEEDFRNRARIHLVIALILGLLLLMTVVGLVLRRIYDVWMRRHYQRMDFLVDGMYNGINT